MFAMLKNLFDKDKTFTAYSIESTKPNPDRKLTRKLYLKYFLQCCLRGFALGALIGTAINVIVFVARFYRAVMIIANSIK